MGEAAAPAGRSVRLVGRDAEEASVRACLDAAAQGARAAVLRGEPGSGKTALWWEAVRDARERDHRVLVARPAEEEMSLALGGLADLLDGTGLDAGALDDQDDVFSRGRALLQALRDAAGDAPIVVGIDDVQWLDSASARVLRYALRRLADAPVAVLVTQRTGLEERDPLELASLLPPGRCDVVELGPLGLEELRRLLGGTTVSRPALRRIHQASGGNPMYALELARSLAGGGASGDPAGALRLPASLQDAVAERLSLVPPGLRPLLELLAASGPIGVGELPALLPSAALDGLLGEAQALGVATVDSSLVVRLAHPLLASAVYAAVPPLARRSLHAELARHARDADVRARHLALSCDEPDPGIAAELDAASARAARRGAPDIAAAFARQAARLTPAAEEQACWQRGFAEIDHLTAAGDTGLALTLADALMARLPPGPARAEAALLRCEVDDEGQGSERLLLRALDDASADPPLRGRVLAALADARVLWTGDMDGAVACAREAVALAREHGDAEQGLRASAHLAHLEALAGTLAPGAMAEIVARAESSASPRLAAGARSMLGKQLVWAGELAPARRLFEATLAELVRDGNEHRRPLCLYELALVECAAGGFARAAELVQAGLELARDADNGWAERLLLYPLALANAWLGHAAGARHAASLRQAGAERRGDRPLVVQARRVLGLLALSEGDAATAAAELGEAARLLDELGIRHPGAFPVLPDAVEALARAGEHEHAAMLLARLERQADGGGAWAAASADRARGVLHAATGEPEAAFEPLRRSTAALARLGYQPDAARSELAYGSALLRAAHRQRAADALAAARGSFAAMGAVLWEARAAAELERAAPGRATGTLTAAERRVAALVSSGLRNREIGQTLFMSVATVEGHLTRTYRKLGIRSRSELARLVADGSVSTDAE